MQIPVVALGVVMVVVSITTFNWGSIKRIRKVPKTDTIVMISTVAVVLLTHNLAYGIFLGIVLSEIFFASTLNFIDSFDFTEKISCPFCIDMNSFEYEGDCITKKELNYMTRNLNIDDARTFTI